MRPSNIYRFSQALIFSATAASLIATKRAYNNHSDIQSNTSVIGQIKQKDLPTAMDALNRKLNFRRYGKPNKRLTITDIGSSDGEFVLDAFVETGTFFLLHACEPKRDRVEAYKRRIAAINEELNEVRIVARKVEAKGVEEYEIPQSDLLFASHSLYYTDSLWSKPAQPGTPHFFDKLFQSLEKNGVLQVTMQSMDTSLAEGYLDNASFESEGLYPILNLYQETPSKVTTAEDFNKALMQYQSIRGLDLEIQTDTSLIDINISPINLDRNLCGWGWYDQSSDGQSLLRTYSRGRFDEFSRYHQDKFMRFLKENSKVNTAGKRVMRHANKIFTVKVLAPTNEHRRVLEI